ncbi:hypothetical protein HDV01_002135 [Terramyces sp. JEL0728]|nr:hypothetical protein HDV01_002135 [Terramyces sp. JEL0728]
MYTALTDILLYLGNMNNLLYGFLWGHTRPDNIGCQFAASFVSFAVFLNMSITCSYVLNIYLNVCKERCYLKADGGKQFAWIFTAVEVTLFNTTAVCFYLIYSKVDSMEPKSQSTAARKSVLKRETVRKIRPYIIYSYALENTPDWDDPTIMMIPMPGYYYVYGIGWPLMQLGFLGSIYILFRAWNRYRLRGSCPAQVRFPMYIAITDIMLYVGHMNNQGYGLIWGHTRPQNLGCQMAAAYVAFGIFCNMAITTSIAVNSYLIICRDWHINTGAWDWKIIAVCGTFAFIFAAIGAPFSGPCLCYFKITGTKALAWIMGSIEVGLFNITAACFFLVIKKIDSLTMATAQSEMMPSTMDGKPAAAPKIDRKAELKRRTVKKTMFYIINYVVGHLFDYRPDWVFVLVNISINLGGILNVFSYIFNEGWSDHPKSPAGAKVKTESQAGKVASSAPSSTPTANEEDEFDSDED